MPGRAAVRLSAQKGKQEQAVMTPATTLDEAITIVENYEGPAEDLELAIADTLLDPVGMNMAIITDKILAKGFEPNGYEQNEGFRVYKYKGLE